MLLKEDRGRKPKLEEEHFAFIQEYLK